jgi:hypothetical protein
MIETRKDPKLDPKDVCLHWHHIRSWWSFPRSCLKAALSPWAPVLLTWCRRQNLLLFSSYSYHFLKG